YLSRFAFSAGVLKNPADLNDKDYTSRTLSMAETQAEIGGYHLWTHDLDNARAYVSDALKNDPKLGLAHEEQGFLDLNDGKDTESLSEFQQALADDRTLYLSRFASAMMSPEASSAAVADQDAFRQNLLDTLKLNPQYAPPYVQLARLAVRTDNLKSALG